MTAREWQPGQVAMLSDRGGREDVGMCIGGGRVGGTVDEGMARWRIATGEVWSSVASARPLVVIDPEDRLQVARLVDAIEAEARRGTAGTLTRHQEALRSLITPPRPPEPQGLGAVVEDAKGRKWLRMGNDNLRRRWAREGNIGGDMAAWCQYDRIPAVRVLSDGVPQ
jgi:hypothetical protein